MRYTGEHKQETRRRVLREAARDIRAKGPEGIGVAGIMARAGLTHGGFYAHFKSKDALVAEAIGTMFEDAGTRFDTVTGGKEEPREALRAYVDFYLSRGHRDARERGCPLPSLSGEIARLDAGTRERFGKGIALLTGRFAEKLERLGATDPAADAGALVAEMVGAVALSRAVADPAQSDAILEGARKSVIGRFGLGMAQ